MSSRPLAVGCRGPVTGTLFRVSIEHLDVIEKKQWEWVVDGYVYVRIYYNWKLWTYKFVFNAIFSIFKKYK